MAYENFNGTTGKASGKWGYQVSESDSIANAFVKGCKTGQIEATIIDAVIACACVAVWVTLKPKAKEFFARRTEKAKAKKTTK